MVSKEGISETEDLADSVPWDLDPAGLPVTQTGRIGLGYCPEPGTFFGVYVGRCQGEDPLSGPECAVMGALDGWRQDKGSQAWAWIRVIGNEWEVDKRRLSGVSEGWLLCKHWVSLEPRFCGCLIGNL